MAAENPNLSPAQREAAKLYEAEGHEPVPAVCVVTGGTGFVGQRLVEMLVERGAKRVVSFDIVPKPQGAWDHPNISYITGSVCDRDAVFDACKGADCVWHVAAAVGPFHPHDLYRKVNYDGTINVLDACRHHNVRKLVMASSPSTRFDGSDVDGLSELEMPALPLKSYMQEYAETKALGEMAVTSASCNTLMTVAVAPHQVYGPRDNLFMPNVLEAAGKRLLRVFSSSRTGYGLNRVCFTHVDNYCHGLVIAEKALYSGSPALGQFYVVTDGNTHPFKEGYAHFWEVVDTAVCEMGFPSIWQRAKLPDWFIMPIAHLCDAFGYLTGMRLKLNPFNVRVLTMHRWFNIARAEEHLRFRPIISFDQGWADMAAWFKQHWLPTFWESGRGAGLAQQSQAKIEIQARN